MSRGQLVALKACPVPTPTPRPAAVHRTAPPPPAAALRSARRTPGRRPRRCWSWLCGGARRTMLQSLSCCCSGTEGAGGLAPCLGAPCSGPNILLQWGWRRGGSGRGLGARRGQQGPCRAWRPFGVLLALASWWWWWWWWCCCYCGSWTRRRRGTGEQPGARALSSLTPFLGALCTGVSTAAAMGLKADWRSRGGSQSGPRAGAGRRGAARVGGAAGHGITASMMMLQWD